MKTASFLSRCRAMCAASALVTLAIFPSASAEDAPRIDALRVARLATDYLATQGRGAPHIVSITWEKDAMLRGTSSWVVRWSHPVLADGNKEIGMRVRADGAVSYLIEEKSAQKRRVIR